MDFTEAKVSEWQWHQLAGPHASLQTDNHASTSPLSFFGNLYSPRMVAHNNNEQT